MKWPKTKQTSNAGVLYIESVVNMHGSIFRRVHQEDDIGIDGYIEIVSEENTSGHLIGVQVKSGDSYLASNGSEFEVYVDEKHLAYWRDYMVPVVLICYSPSKDCAAWVSIRDFIEQEKYHERLPVKSIKIPLYRKFNAESLSKGIAGLAHARADERILLRCADMCLSTDQQERHDGFSILVAHPDSRKLKITAYLARQLLMDENVETAKDALFSLGYAVGRFRWTTNPGNRLDNEAMRVGSSLCQDLDSATIQRLIELIDDEHFSGPQGLGERCFDVLCCCWERAEEVLDATVSDKRQPLQRRSNALYMLYGCDEYALEEVYKQLPETNEIFDVFHWMFGD